MMFGLWCSVLLWVYMFGAATGRAWLIGVAVLASLITIVLVVSGADTPLE